MPHIKQLLEKYVVELSRGNFCSASGQFYECESFVWDVLVAAGVVVGEDKVLIVGLFVDVGEDYVLAVLIWLV